MRNFKKLAGLGLALALVATTVLTGCGEKKDSSGGSDGKTQDKKTVEVIAKGFQHQFWKAVEQGAKKAAGEFNVNMNFQGPDNESAIAQQVEYLRTAISKKPAAICFAALSTEASKDALSEAAAQKIPIIGFDSGVPDAPEGSVKANAATNNTVAGALAATELMKVLKLDDSKVSRIGVVAQDATSQSIGNRTHGFVDKMVEIIGKDKVSVEGHEAYVKKVDGAKIIIEVQIPAEVKDADGVAVTQALLEKKDLVAIYGSNEFSANSIITANEGRDVIGKGKVLAVGFDAGKKQKTAVKDGLFIGSVTQDPVAIGYQAVKLAVAAADGKSVSDVDTGAKWYNAENMESEDIAPNLYD